MTTPYEPVEADDLIRAHGLLKKSFLKALETTEERDKKGGADTEWLRNTLLAVAACEELIERRSKLYLAKPGRP